MNNLIAVSIGDIKGIGIEILINQWKKNKIKNFVLITNYNLFKKYILSKKINIKIHQSTFQDRKLILSKNKFNIFNIEASDYNQNTLLSIKESFKLVKKKIFIGLVTLPINKENINKINAKFIDQTSFLTRKDRKEISNMVFIYKNIFFVPLTTHIKLSNVSKEFKNTLKFFKKINNLKSTLIKDFKINNPKFIIAGINPHMEKMEL